MTLTKLLRTGAAALGALSVASVTQANAADIYSGGGGYKDVPVAPCCSFAGFYIGGNLGIEWSQVEFARRDFLTTDPDGGDFFTIGGKKLNNTGGFGGGQIGYNWQSACCWVYGLELDLGGIAQKSERNFFVPGIDDGVGAAGGRIKVDGGFYGDITGRLGYAWGNSLLYAKGGFAWLNVDINMAGTTVADDGEVTTFRSNNKNTTLTGWTVGAGWEWKPCCQSNWSIKAEYLHFDFGNMDNRCCDDGVNNFKFFKNDLTVDTVKLGFNYYWNTPPVPLK
jgi:outer membrane immunogenic protein